MTLEYKIGVDAGGTHTTAIAYDLAGNELENSETGPGQINADYDKGISNIVSAINNLLKQINGDCKRVLCGIAGLSVVGDASVAAATIAAQIGNIPTRAITDSLLALYNGLKGQDGSLVIAGTGSVFNGLQDGHMITTGGYGNLLGDEGSGYAITLSAIKSALLSWDKRENNSLINMFNNLFEVNNLKEVTAKFYKLLPSEIAGLAVNVANLAEKGDNNAQKIIYEQAELLARDIIIGINRYKDPKPMKIALTGSVLANNQMFREHMIKQVHAAYPQASFSISNGENARGVIYDQSSDYRNFTSRKN